MQFDPCEAGSGRTEIQRSSPQCLVEKVISTAKKIFTVSKETTEKEPLRGEQIQSKKNLKYVCKFVCC